VNNEKVSNEMRKLEVGDYIGFGVNPFPERYYETNQFVFSLQRYQSEQTVEIADDDITDGSGKSTIENMDHTYNLNPVDNFTLKVTNPDDFTTQYEFDFSDDIVKPQSENQLKDQNLKYEKPSHDLLWNLFSDSDDTSDDETTRSCDYTSHFSVNSKNEQNRLSVERSETVKNALCDFTKETEISFAFENSKVRSFSENFNVGGKIPTSSSKTRSISTSTPKAGSVPKTLSISQLENEKESTTLLDLLQRPSKHEETKPQSNASQNLVSTSNCAKNVQDFKNIVSIYEQGIKNLKCGNQNILTKSSSAGHITSKILQKPPRVEVIRRLSIDCRNKPKLDFSNLASNLANMTPKIIKKPLLTEDFRRKSAEISKISINASNSGSVHHMSNIAIKNSPNKIKTYTSKYQNKKTETITSGSLAQSSQKSKNFPTGQPENSTAVDVYGTFEPESENNKFVPNYYDNVTDNEDENETRNIIVTKNPEIIEKIATANVSKAVSNDQVKVIIIESNIINTADYITIQQQPSTSNHISQILESESKKRPLTTFSYKPSNTCQVIPEDKDSTNISNREEIKKSSNYDDNKMRFQKAIKSVMEMAVKTKPNQHRKTQVDKREVGSSESKQPQMSDAGKHSEDSVEKSINVQQINHNLSTELKKNDSDMLRNLLLKSSTSVPSKEDELFHADNSRNSYQIQSELVGSTSHEEDSQIKQTKKIDSCSTRKIQNVSKTSKSSNLKKNTQSNQQKPLKHVKHTSNPPRIRRTDAEINRDLELYSKMLVSRSNKLKATNVPPKIANSEKLIPKNQKLDTNVKLLTQNTTKDSKKSDTKPFDKSIQSKIDSEKPPELPVLIKAKKLTSVAVDGIKEIFQKAVEEIKEKIISAKDQEVAQEIEREISKVLKIVAASDDDDDEILDEKSGVFVKMEKKDETGNEKSLNNPMTNLISNQNIINVQSNLPVVSNLVPGVINFAANSTVAANPINVIPNLITTMPIVLAATNISPRNINDTSSFTPIYTAPVPYHMVNTTVISSNNTNLSTFNGPNVNAAGQYGQVGANYYQNVHHTPKNLSQMSDKSNLESFYLESTKFGHHSSNANTNFHQAAANVHHVPVYPHLIQGNTVQYSPEIVQTSQQNLRKTSLNSTDSQQFLSQYPQNQSQGHQNLPSFIPTPTITNTNYISVASYSTKQNQILPLENDSQPNLSRKSIIVYPSHSSVKEPTEEVTILNLEPAKRTLSISNLLETSKQILINNNAESDNSYVNEIFFPQNFVDVSHPNDKLSSVYSQNNLNADQSDSSQNGSKILEVAKNDLIQSENLNDDSIQAYTTLEKNTECSTNTNDENLDSDAKNNNDDDVIHECDSSYCENDEAKIKNDAESMNASQSNSVTPSLQSYDEITKNVTENENTDSLLRNTQITVINPAKVDRETSESKEEDSLENETEHSNKDTPKPGNALHNKSSNENDCNNCSIAKQNELNELTSSVEVEEDIQIFDDTDSVINKSTTVENEIEEPVEGK